MTGERLAADSSPGAAGPPWDGSVAKLFQVLSRPGRLQLLELLIERELTLEQLALEQMILENVTFEQVTLEEAASEWVTLENRAVRLAPGKARISAELADLIDCGCVSEDRAGRIHRYRADPRAREVVNLVRAFVTDCAKPLNICRYIQDEAWLDEINRSGDAPGITG